MLEIFLFGEPRLVYRGREQSFEAPPKAMPLLAYLLLHRQSAIPREAVAQTLWPDATEEEARANLRRHIHYVRKALPEGDWVLATTRTLQWNPDAPYRVDVGEFEQQSRVEPLRKFAVQLYAGDLLQRYLDDEWLLFERERLRNLQLGNLSSLIAQAEDAQDFAAIDAYAHMLLALDPWREDALRTMMRARVARGDRSGALAVFDRFRERLDEELAIAPMAETTALFSEIARSGEEAVPGSPGGAQAFDDRPFVGREGELQTLHRQLMRASGGRGTAALVGGEAGIGKTRLLEALAAKASELGARVLTGRASPEMDAPYQVLTGALECAQMPLRELEPGLIESSGRRAGLFSAIGASLETLANEAPVVLCLEDLHWATTDTIALVEFLVRRLREAPILIVGTYREESVGPHHPIRTLRRLLSGTPSFSHLVLNALSREAVAELIRVCLPDPDDKLVDEIYRRSEGNAFFVTELIEHVARHGFIDVPQSVKHLTAERVEQLSEPARKLVRTLAIAGREVGFELISTLSPLPENELVAVLRELIAARILREDGDFRAYGFVHEIVRQALYDRFSTAERTAEHAYVASVLTSTFGAAARYAGVIAYHEERADLVEPAAAHYVDAARYAFSVAANAEAEEYCRKAIALSHDAPTKYEAFLVLDELLARTAQWQKEREVLDEIDELVRLAGDQIDAYRATRARLSFAIGTDDTDALPALIERFASEIPDDPLWHARKHFFESAYYFQLTNEERAFESTYRALELYRKAGDAFGQLYCHVRLLELCDRHGRPHRENLEAARALAEAIDTPDAAYLLAFVEAKLFLHVDRSLSQYAALRMLEFGELSADPVRMGVAHSFLGAIATYRFELEQSQMHFEAAEELIAGAGRAIDRVRLLRFRALRSCCVVDFESSLRDSEEAIALARSAKAYELLNIVVGNTLQYLRYTGEYERAIELGEETRAFFKSSGIDFRFGHLEFGLAEIYFQTGQIERALELAHYCHDWATKRGFTVNGSIVGAWFALAYAHIGDYATAKLYVDGYLGSVDTVILEGHMPQETIWRIAQVQRALGDEAEANRLLGRAMDAITRRVDALPDEESRRRYLRFRINEEIVRAYSGGPWPSIGTALPSAV